MLLQLYISSNSKKNSFRGNYSRKNGKHEFGLVNHESEKMNKLEIQSVSYKAWQSTGYSLSE